MTISITRVCTRLFSLKILSTRFARLILRIVETFIDIWNVKESLIYNVLRIIYLVENQIYVIAIMIVESNTSF